MWFRTFPMACNVDQSLKGWKQEAWNNSCIWEWEAKELPGNSPRIMKKWPERSCSSASDNSHLDYMDWRVRFNEVGEIVGPGRESYFGSFCPISMVGEGMALTYQSRWEEFQSTHWRDYGYARGDTDTALPGQYLLSCRCSTLAPGTKCGLEQSTSREHLREIGMCWMVLVLPAWRTTKARCWLEPLHYRVKREDTRKAAWTTRVWCCKDALSTVRILRKVPELKLSSWDHSHKRSAFGCQQQSITSYHSWHRPSKMAFGFCFLPSALHPFPVLSPRGASNQRKRKSREGRPNLLLPLQGRPSTHGQAGSGESKRLCLDWMGGRSFDVDGLELKNTFIMKNFQTCIKVGRKI